MRRKFAEVDDTGTVIEIHDAEVKGARGNSAREPKTAIRKQKASHQVIPNGHVNKGDKWSEKHGCFLRPLQRSDELRAAMNAKLEAKRQRELSRAEEKGARVKS